MEPIVVTTIASTAVSLLIPFLKTIGNGMVKKVSEEIGKSSQEMAWKKTQQIFDKIKATFAKSPAAKEALKDLQASPDDEDSQASVRLQLKKILASDEKFATELAMMLKEASDAGVDAVFHTTIMGNVQKFVQIGNVKGDINI